MQDTQGMEGGQECLWDTSGKVQSATDHHGAEAKVVRDIVLTCVVLHNMLRSHQGGGDRPLTTADDI